MIELNKKTNEDFLNRKQMKNIIDAGIDVSNGKYIIAKDKLSINDGDYTDYIWYKDSTAEVYDVCPTLTIQELLQLLNEKETLITSLYEMLLKYHR